MQNTCLGVDYGTSNVGLAISQVGIAIPHSTIPTASAKQMIHGLVKSEGITHVIVGHAIGYDASGKQARMYESFMETLREYLPNKVEVNGQDEDLSTFEAQETLNTLNNHNKDHLDDVAASIILQRYLDNTF